MGDCDTSSPTRDDHRIPTVKTPACLPITMHHVVTLSVENEWLHITFILSQLAGVGHKNQKEGGGQRRAKNIQTR